MEHNPKIALVTGAGSGIGRAVALALASNGYHVVLSGRRFEKLEETASLAKPPIGRMLAVAADVSQPHAVDALFATTREEFGRLDLLFNNAGANVPATPIEDLTFAQWNQVLGVNLTGAFLCAQAAVRLMKSQHPRGGRIINNGSISAHAPRPNSVPYSTTKHAITGLTKCLSLDGRVHDIACGQIDIGNTLTDLSARFQTGTIQANGEMRVEPTFDVTHVADAVVYMAGLPLEANVQFMTIMATKMPFVGRG